MGSDRIPTELDVLVAGRPTKDLLVSQQRLRALIIPYAGVPAETRTLLLEHFQDLAVYNLHHNAVAASELAFALFLAAAKTLIPVDRTFRMHDWRSRYDGAPTLLLDGKTAVILGFGAIGRRIAASCKALGMHVHALRRTAKHETLDGIQVHPSKELAEILPLAHALFVALPLTPETEGMIGKREIGWLSPNCVLVNIARGKVIDEAALYAALRDQHLAAAGIDVWYEYPKSEASRANTPPSRFPFHELDNVVMSPHRGGAFLLEELEQRRMTDLAGTLNALSRGESPTHRVDVLAGY